MKETTKLKVKLAVLDAAVSAFGRFAVYRLNGDILSSAYYRIEALRYSAEYCELQIAMERAAGNPTPEKLIESLIGPSFVNYKREIVHQRIRFPGRPNHSMTPDNAASGVIMTLFLWACGSRQDMDLSLYAPKREIPSASMASLYRKAAI